MFNNDQDLKLNLVNFLIKTEGYKVSKNDSNTCSFLINKKAKNPIVIISLGSLAEKHITIAKEIKKNLKTANREKINMLNIVLGNANFNENDDFQTIIISDLNFFVEQLKDLFPNIVNMSKNDNNDKADKQMSDEEIMSTLLDPQNSNDQEFKRINNKIKNSPSIMTYILIAIFAFGPITIFFVSVYFVRMKNLIMLQYSEISSLFFGGLDHNLTIVVGQYWRILTWGMTPGPFGSSIFTMVFLFFILIYMLNISKYAEHYIGKLKYISAVLLAYIFTGFFIANGILTGVEGGPIVILSAIIGALGASIIGKKTTTTVMAKNKLIIGIIIVAVIPLLNRDVNSYMIAIISCGLSMSFIYMFNYKYKKMDYLIAIPILIIIGVFTSSLTMLIIPKYTQAENGNTIGVLQSYWQIGFYSHNNLNSIFDKIGWNIVAGLSDDGKGLILYRTW